MTKPRRQFQLITLLFGVVAAGCSIPGFGVCLDMYRHQPQHRALAIAMACTLAMLLAIMIAVTELLARRVKK